MSLQLHKTKQKTYAPVNGECKKKRSVLSIVCAHNVELIKRRVIENVASGNSSSRQVTKLSQNFNIVSLSRMHVPANLDAVTLVNSPYSLTTIALYP